MPGLGVCLFSAGEIQVIYAVRRQTGVIDMQMKRHIEIDSSLQSYQASNLRHECVRVYVCAYVSVCI